MMILFQNFSAITTSQLLESRRRRHIIPACPGVHQVAKKLDTTEALEVTRHSSNHYTKGKPYNFFKKTFGQKHNVDRSSDRDSPPQPPPPPQHPYQLTSRCRLHLVMIKPEYTSLYNPPSLPTSLLSSLSSFSCISVCCTEQLVRSTVDVAMWYKTGLPAYDASQCKNAIVRDHAAPVPSKTLNLRGIYLSIYLCSSIYVVAACA